MYNDEYKRWLAADLEDADLYPELAKIEGNEEEIEICFSKKYLRLYRIQQRKAIILYEPTGRCCRQGTY